MEDRVAKLRKLVGIQEPSEESKRLGKAQADNIGIDLSNIQQHALGAEIPQGKVNLPSMKRPTPPPYGTNYPSDEKFEAARQRAGGMRSPASGDMSALREYQNKLDMVESEEAFDGPTKQSEEEKMRLRALIQKLGGS